MDKPRSPEVIAFWEAFRRAHNVAPQEYDVCRVGSSPEMGDELLALALKGLKRATACQHAAQLAGRAHLFRISAPGSARRSGAGQTEERQRQRRDRYGSDIDYRTG